LPLRRGRSSLRELGRIVVVHGEGQAETETVLDHHFVAVVDADLRRLEDICAASFELGVQRIDVSDPHVGVEAAFALNGVMRRASSWIGLTQLNFDVVAGDNGKDWRLAKIAEDAESQDVAVILGGSDDVGHGKLRRDRFQLRLVFAFGIHRLPNPDCPDRIAQFGGQFY
jgi:hypothetical protein